MPLTPLLSAYDHVLLDLDGCVWVGDVPTPRAVLAIDALRDAGKGIAFVTNNAMHPAEDFVRKLWGLGFRAAVEEVVTAGHVVQEILTANDDWDTAFVIGAPALHRNVRAAGLNVLVDEDEASGADVVVVAAHESFDFAQLRTACLAVAGGAPIIASDRDASYPVNGGFWPGTGSVLAALETATGAEATVAGKPGAEIFHVALERLGPGRAIVIGDRLDADMAGATAAGIDGALVLTGTTSEAEALAWSPAPVAVAATLADLVLGRAAA